MPTSTPSPLPLADEAVSRLRLQRGSWATRAKAGKRFYQMLAASLLVHLVLTPAPAWLGLLAKFGALETEELPPEDALTGIPVDLISDEVPAEPTPPPEALPPPAASQPTILPDPAEPASAEPAPVAPPEAQPGAGDEPAPVAQEKKPSDPVSLAGAAGKLADSNANVRILLYTDVVRSHPLGTRIGGLLRRSPQWSDFFGPTNVDPIRDIDRVLIAGPELRDTKNVVAVIGHHLPEDEIDRALERLVDRNGEWISRSPRLARATADRATRLFAAPRKGIVAVAPLSVEKSLARLGKRLSFPDALPGTAASIYVAKPSRPLRALGFRLPESIAWLSIRVVPDASGGVTLELSARDESEALAQEHAESLEVLLRRASEIDLSKMGAMGALAAFALGGSKQRVVESIELESRGDHIEGVVKVTARQLQNLADLLDAILPPPTVEAARRPLEEEPETQDKDRGEAVVGSGGTASSPSAPADGEGRAPDAGPGPVSPEEAPTAPGESGPGQPEPPGGPAP